MRNSVASEGSVLAARLAAQLAEMVQGAANRHRGHVVKLLGDGVMFHFPRPVDAVLQPVLEVGLRHHPDLADHQ